MKALIIGRFQPLHKGHCTLLDYAIKHYDCLHIGIGSSQYHSSFDNPYSYEERRNMLMLYFKSKNSGSYTIHPIPDIHDPPHWVAHLKTIISDFDCVITNNPQTKTLFEDAGILVETPGLVHREKLKGVSVRKLMFSHQQWENFVPESIISYLKTLPITDNMPNPKH